jgi:hypothetical protein
MFSNDGTKSDDWMNALIRSTVIGCPGLKPWFLMKIKNSVNSGDCSGTLFSVR